MAAPLADPRQFADATALADAVAAGRRPPSDVIVDHLDRIRRVHRSLNGAVEVFDTAALEHADAASGPLAGVPVSVKETVGLAGTPITAGSTHLPPQAPAEDASVVMRLRSAGATILARGNLSELGMTHDTVNRRFGRTHNPLNPDYSPGGSSGGDAALVAAGCVAAGIGTDLGGSVRYPAHCCGLVGFKPHAGAIDATGIGWPGGPEPTPSLVDSFHAVGTLTRSVRDARRLYAALSSDALDAPTDAHDIRLVVPQDFAMTLRDDRIRAAYDEAQDVLARTGMRTTRVGVPDAGSLYRAYLTVLAAEAIPHVLAQLQAAGDGSFSLAAEWARHAARRPSLHFALLRLLTTMQTVSAGPDARRTAEQRIENARRKLRRLLGADGLLLLPTNGALALRPGQAARYMAWPRVRPVFTPTIYPNVANLSAITVPAWTHRDASTGLVPGLTLAARPGAEARLLDGAALLERVLAPSATPAPKG
jgi:Asp-tRNA(Asn)/Glu-tRNA(Gln) amidotransferase A subunit family amidase